MGNHIEKVYFSEEDIDQMTSELIAKIQASGEHFSLVIGIKNGGIPISTKISQALGVGHATVRISHYEGTQFRDRPLIEEPEHCHMPGHILVVDDLVDTGVTISTFHHYFGGNSMVAVLFWNKAAEQRPDFYVKEKPNAWVVFPWEV